MQRIARPFGPAARCARPPAAATRAAFSRARCVRVRASAEYDALKGLRVLKASTGEPVELLDLWQVRWSAPLAAAAAWAPIAGRSSH
jgi:hypothetical protein